MSTLVTVDAHEGTLRRYECGGSAVRLTHACTNDGAATFTPKVVENFRLNPPDWCRVEPDPRPTGPSCGAGTPTVIAA